MITRSVLPRICPKLSFREEGTGAGGGSTGEEACEMEVMFIGDFTAKEGASGDARIVPRALWPFGCDTAGGDGARGDGAGGRRRGFGPGGEALLPYPVGLDRLIQHG